MARSMQPSGAAPGCVMVVNCVDNISSPNPMTIAFAGENGGTVEFFTLGTTARFAISNSPHWGILFEGPVRVNGRVCKYVLCDLYTSEIRFQGNDNMDELCTKSGIRQDGGRTRLFGEERAVSLALLPKLVEKMLMDIFFDQSHNLKNFDMSYEFNPRPQDREEAYKLVTKSTWRSMSLPEDREEVEKMFAHLHVLQTTNCKRFALVVGYVLGLKLPDMVQAFAILTMRAELKKNPEYKLRQIEMYVAQGRPRMESAFRSSLHYCSALTSPASMRVDPSLKLSADSQ